MNIRLSQSLSMIVVPVVLSVLLTSCGNNSQNGANSTPDNLVTGELKPLAILDQAGATIRVSVAQDLSQADAGSIYSSLSSNGEIVVFDSSANNLDGLSSGGFFQIFAKNRRDDSVHRVSVAIDGGIANGASTQPDVSDDGVFVAFVSEASNLVNNDDNNVADIFVRDVLRQVTTRVSVASDGSAANAASTAPSISADGRFVVFQSLAALSADDTNNFQDIYIHDMNNGETQLLSRFAAEPGNGDSTQAKISANGEMVVFASNASNLVANGDNNGASDIFRVNRVTGAIDLVSVNYAGVAANGASDSPSVNVDGSVVSFRSIAGDLLTAAAPMALYQIFTRDLSNNSVEMISVSNSGEAANNSVFSGTVMSDDAMFVAYYTAADNLHINDNNGVWDVYVRDRANHNTRLISVDSSGQAGFGSSFVPAINSDGHFISYGSSATNLVSGDSNDQWDVFIHVLQPHNFPPVALAGDDVSVYVGANVSLNGGQSYDPDASVNGVGPVKAYRWTLLDKPLNSNIAMDTVSTAAFDFVADVAGDYVFELVVNDGVQDSAADIITVSAKNNLPPQAQLQIDIVRGNAPLTVNVSAAQSTDPEGDALNYNWDFADPNADSTNPNSSDQIEASHVYTQAGEYTIVLSVGDSAGNSVQTAVTVTVLAANHAPIISPAANIQSGGAPLTVQFFANASDADNDNLQFSWDFGDGSAVVNDENPQHVFLSAGEYSVQLTVSDGHASVSAQLVISVDGDLTFAVRRAYLELDKARPAHDKVSLDLYVQQNLFLNSDDVVTIKLDGIELLSMTVMELQLAAKANWHYSLTSDSHDQRYLQCAADAGYSLIRFSQSAAGIKLRLKMRRFDFNGGLSLGNGIDVQLSIGSRSGLRNILMTALPTHCQSLRRIKGHAGDNESCDKDGGSDSKSRYIYGRGYTDKNWISTND